MKDWLYLIFGGLLLTIGDLVFKSWVINPRLSMYVTGFVIYMSGIACLIETFKNKNMAIATAIIVMVNIVTLALVSRFYYLEELSPNKIVGLILALSAIYFLES